MVDGCGSNANLVIAIAVNVAGLAAMRSLGKQANALCVRARGILRY